MVYKDVIRGFFNNIDNYLISEYLIDDRYFSREGKISYYDAVAYPLTEKGRTGAVESEDYLINKSGDEDLILSKPAMGQKRMGINPQIYVDMNEDLIDPVFSEISKEGTFKRFIPAAFDSSICDSPNTKLTYDEYNHIKYAKLKKELLRLRASCTVDTINGFVLTSKITSSKIDEITLAHEHLENIDNRYDISNFIFMGDRFYSALGLMYDIHSRESNFLIRIKSDDFVNECKWMTSNDEIIQVNLNKNKVKNFNSDELKEKALEEGLMNIRITEIEIRKPNGKKYIERIASNLPMDEITPKDIKELYNSRWKIETDFNRLKNIIVIENFTGHRKRIIEQDFYSDIILLNLMLLSKHSIDKLVKKDDYERGRKRYQTNLNTLYGKFKCYIFDLISKIESKMRKALDKIWNFGRRNLVLLKNNNDRNPDRIWDDPTNDFPYSNKRGE